MQPRYAAPITEIRILGPLEVTTADGLLAVTGPRERIVLAVLAMSAGRVVSVDRIVDAVWGDSPPPSSAKVLQNLVLKLRRSLGAGAIETGPGGYRLVEEGVITDASRFEHDARAGRELVRAGDAEAAITAFAAALDAWRGDPLPELQHWAAGEGEAARLSELHRSVQEDRCDAALAAGRHQEVVGELETMVIDEPLRERRWYLLAVALYRDGRQAEALRALQRARAALGEIGLDPGPELRELERAISTQDRSLDGPRAARHLPAALTRFIGRASELREITELLTTSRAVTLSGAGGSGKTRLALEVAGERQAGTGDVWFVELLPTVDEPSVVTALASALGIQARSEGGDPLAPIIELLTDRPALIVLDNCEHVVEAAARVAYALLRGCADLRVLATSREPLGLPGEAVYVVPSMGMPSVEASLEAVGASDAGALFCDRARVTNAGFRIDDADADAIASICCRLDGLPLAIELAAAWARKLGVREIARRLDDSFDLLRGGPRVAMAHHQTIQAALDWSYSLLTGTEQAGLRWLGVFPDEFDLAAGTELLRPLVEPDAGSDLAAVDLVARLVDKSLVVLHTGRGEACYRLLVPIAQYARAKLAEAEETAAAIAGHDRVFLARAGGRLRAGVTMDVATSQASYGAALERAWRRGDVGSAKMLALAQSHAWFWAGDPSGREWMERLAAVTTPADPELDTYVLLLLVSTLSDSGGPSAQRRRELLDRAAMLGRGTGAEPVVTYAEGEFELAHGGSERARSLFEQVRAGAEHDASWVFVGWCDDHLGWSSVTQGRFDDARASFRGALEMADRTGDEWLATHAVAALAPLSVKAGDVQVGCEQAERAIAMARRLDAGLAMMALARAAEADVLAEDRGRCGRHLGELAANLRRSRRRRWLADTLETGALLAEPAEPDLAVSLLGAAKAVRTASEEQLGGRRVITADVLRARDRLADVLSADDFGLAWERGADWSTTNALDELLAWLARSAEPAPAAR